MGAIIINPNIITDDRVPFNDQVFDIGRDGNRINDIFMDGTVNHANGLIIRTNANEDWEFTTAGHLIPKRAGLQLGSAGQPIDTIFAGSITELAQLLLENNEWIESRNFADTQNENLLRLNTSDNTELNSPNSGLIFQIAGTPEATLDASNFRPNGAAGLGLGSPTEPWGSSYIRTIISDAGQPLTFDGTNGSILFNSAASLAWSMDATTFRPDTAGTHEVGILNQYLSNVHTLNLLAGSGQNLTIRTTTTDGTDNRVVDIAGGGGVSAGRGAYITLHGNEHANAGDLHLVSGNVAGGAIEMYTDGTKHSTWNVGSGYKQVVWNDDFRMFNDSNSREVLIGSGANAAVANGALIELYGSAHATDADHLILNAGSGAGDIIFGLDGQLFFKMQRTGSGAQLIGNDTNFDIHCGSLDAADNRALRLTGGGGFGSARGGMIEMFGNENAATGAINYIAGNVSGGTHSFHTQGAVKFVIQDDANPIINFKTGSCEIFTDTADASDTRSLSLGAGGAIDVSRSAHVQIFGNEHATQAGNLRLEAGATGEVIINSGSGGGSTVINTANGAQETIFQNNSSPRWAFNNANDLTFFNSALIRARTTDGTDNQTFQIAGGGLRLSGSLHNTPRK